MKQKQMTQKHMQTPTQSQRHTKVPRQFSLWVIFSGFHIAFDNLIIVFLCLTLYQNAESFIDSYIGLDKILLESLGLFGN